MPSIPSPAFVPRQRASFFRSVLAAIAIFGATAASAQTVEFRGSAVLSDWTPACTAAGWSGEAVINVRYRPPSLGSNGPTTRLTMHFPAFRNPAGAALELSALEFYSVAFRLETGELNKNFKNVAASSISSRQRLTPFARQAKVKVTQRTPANIDLGTNSITLVGQITNFDAVRDCRVAFRAGMVRRP